MRKKKRKRKKERKKNGLLVSPSPSPLIHTLSFRPPALSPHPHGTTMAPTTTPPPPSTGPPSPTPAAVRVSPLVLLAAADAYTRRPDGAGRVVGTLLGVASPETGLVDVRDCFVVPHSEANGTVSVACGRESGRVAVRGRRGGGATGFRPIGDFLAGGPGRELRARVRLHQGAGAQS